MHQRPTSATADPAYKAGAIALMLAVASIIAAFGFQYIGGYAPCPLCLMQRYAYYAGIPLLFGALVLVATDRAGWAAALFFLVALAFLANAGLGVYHAGAEWKFWPGPDTCAAAPAKLSLRAGDLLNPTSKMSVVRCDEAAWRMFGISFAGYNVLISLLLACGSFVAARQSWARP